MSSDSDDLSARIALLEAECNALRAQELATRQHAEIANRRLAFLSESSALLAHSLDYEATLSVVARIAIPFLGDSCVLHLIDPDGAIRYVEQAHIIPEKEELVRQLRRRHPLTWESQHPLIEVLRSGRSFVTQNANAFIRDQVEHDPAGLRVLDALSYRSVLIVPLIVRNEVTGALSLIVSESDRSYDEGDVAFAEELANRAAQAIENARLYRLAQEALQHKDALLAELQHTQQQLLHAQRLESVGRLAAGIAHDFNNLLTVISGYTELSRNEAGLSSALQGDLAEINEAVLRAAALTRQLLTFARKQPFAAQLLDSAVLLRGVERLIRRLLSEDIQISSIIPPDLWPIYADPRQIEQVLINLAVNARDAMPHGGTIEMTATNLRLGQAYNDSHVHVAPGEYLLIQIRDTGSGIPEAIRQQIFEPFFTTKEQGKGTGLGLSICYGIIQQHHGAITLHSIPDQGTIFSIYLPRSTNSTPEVVSDAASTRSGGTERILVVEDEAGVRELVARILRERGYEVLVAEHGAAALALLASNQGRAISLIVSDVRMPTMSGPALMRQLYAQGSPIAMLFMSGYTDSQLSEQELRSLQARLIYKPFAAEHLARMVRQAIDSASVAAPPEPG